MPKSRDERCRQAIDSYMTNAYAVQYNINSLTKNKSGSLHSYEIVMPRLIKLYDVDTYHTINGTESGPGTISGLSMFVASKSAQPYLCIDHFFHSAL